MNNQIELDWNKLKKCTFNVLVIYLTTLFLCHSHLQLDLLFNKFNTKFKLETKFETQAQNYK